MIEALQELGTHLELKRTDCVLSWEVAHDELTVTVAPSSLVGSSIGFMVRIVENSDNVWCVCGTNMVIKILIFLKQNMKKDLV